MRVKISTNPPLPPVRAWFPLAQASTHGQTVSTLKSLLCTSLSAFRGTSSTSLQLSIDGFELLDDSELTVVRDGDLISVDVRVPIKQALSPSDERDVALRSRAVRTKQAAPTRKRKRTPSTASSGSESDTESSSSESESESGSETSSNSGAGSESDVSSVSSKGKGVPARKRAQTIPAKATPRPVASTCATRPTFVPPGYGKPQTRARNLRRRHKRKDDRDAEGGPVSGSNAVVPDEAAPTLMSLSLRNKNKAKNFKSLMGRPLPPKIIFGDESTVENPNKVPRLIPPSMRASVPANVIVTSVDVESERTVDAEADVVLDYGGEEEVDVGEVEAMANERWTTLARPTREAPGTVVGYKALGIDAETHTPGIVLSVCRVESAEAGGLVVRPMRAVSFDWGNPENAEAEMHSWEEIDGGDWRVL